MEHNELKEVFPVEKGNFETAGEASSRIKHRLKKLGIAPEIVRDAAIVAYEAELNLVIHSLGGELELVISPSTVTLISRDVGPGIPDIALALRGGYSTAPESVRMMGFGAGMGLPNIKRHSQEFQIESEPGKGTVIKTVYHIG
ncbi:MAG: ATP-binding protein [Eubacteriales bacterium]|nr:ATP-binding protein [Eubacteriales bacterium]